MCKSHLHTLPATKTHPYRCVSRLFDRVFLTRGNGRSASTSEYKLNVLGDESIELTKGDGTVYRTTRHTCTCPSRLPCVHRAMVRVLIEQDDLTDRPELEYDPNEVVDEMDAYYAARPDALPFC